MPQGVWLIEIEMNQRARKFLNPTIICTTELKMNDMNPNQTITDHIQRLYINMEALIVDVETIYTLV